MTPDLEQTFQSTWVVFFFLYLMQQLWFSGPEEDDQVLFNDELPHTGQRSQNLKCKIVKSGVKNQTLETNLLGIIRYSIKYILLA